MDRIVVTGMGLVSPLGVGVNASWKRLVEGRSGLRQLPEEMVGDLAAKVGGVVPDISEDLEAGFDADRYVPVKDQKKMDRFILFAMAAAEEAILQAGWQPTESALWNGRPRSSHRASAAFPPSPMLCARRKQRACGVCRPSPSLPSSSISPPAR
jgi:3-oxoacyl-(acyl-carrier-protein) synthase